MLFKCFFNLQENTQLEAQLFRLYHNEQEIEHLTSELQNKEKEVGGMEKKRNTIEEKLKGKRQEHARMSREIAAIEKQIRDKVRERFDHSNERKN